MKWVKAGSRPDSFEASRRPSTVRRHTDRIDSRRDSSWRFHRPRSSRYRRRHYYRGSHADNSWNSLQQYIDHHRKQRLDYRPDSLGDNWLDSPRADNDRHRISLDNPEDSSWDPLPLRNAHLRTGYHNRSDISGHSHPGYRPHPRRFRDNHSGMLEDLRPRRRHHYRIWIRREAGYRPDNMGWRTSSFRWSIPLLHSMERLAHRRIDKILYPYSENCVSPYPEAH